MDRIIGHQGVGSSEQFGQLEHVHHRADQLGLEAVVRREEQLGDHDRAPLEQGPLVREGLETMDTVRTADAGVVDPAKRQVVVGR